MLSKPVIQSLYPLVFDVDKALTLLLNLISLLIL